MRHFENLKTGGKAKGEFILEEADETIDLLNNERARAFYKRDAIQDKSNIGIVRYYLGIFRHEGFYVADITYNAAHTAIEKVDIKLQRLDEATYIRAMRSLNELSEVGLTAKRQAIGEAAEKASNEYFEALDKSLKGHPEPRHGPI